MKPFGCPQCSSYYVEEVFHIVTERRLLYITGINKERTECQVVTKNYFNDDEIEADYRCVCGYKYDASAIYGVAEIMNGEKE